MNDDMLKLWGLATGNLERPSRPKHQIARSMVHRSREDYIRDKLAWSRATGPRRYRASGGAIPGHAVSPQWATDPVSAQDDSGRYRGLSADLHETPQVQAIQSTWVKLATLFPDQAEILAAEYKTSGTQAQKAALLGIPERTYKYKLARARAFFGLSQG